ncbi:hypothetical protein BAUCODRAFT_26381 [Baudoinia panamericana UAMH 10762]|uniref:RNA 3'-terminal phosphate cyclase domain-containing protein n=1 Tax=Baudoinia panamericana (strain UAMH 10762) TaxID=717646 RepID=M2MRT4_BAUPA|nr:uncharacterized protein BAUCODRAFT_26381 [Baudoinia panamericana UAMH 10762]EMC94203.1 hypothetical protein BAUCODRAFT_26381 [Baudoinia panamericana UAMH 10762]
MAAAPPGSLSLDGRTLEGGGQLLRIAVCLAALTGSPVQIHNIRGNRSGGGGLKAQHLACVDWLGRACQAHVEGAVKCSRTLSFVPAGAKFGFPALPPVFKKQTLSDGRRVWDSSINIGTAGSTGLALQAVLPFVLFTRFPSTLPIRLTFTGGTNVSGSPSFEYITQVLLPTLQALGFPEMHAKLEKRGWSHGGTSIGSFTLEISARAFVRWPEPFRLWRSEEQVGRLVRPSNVQATFIAPSSCHDHFRQRFRQALEDAFQGGERAQPMDTEVTCENSKHDKRLYFIVVATISTGKQFPTHHATVLTVEDDPKYPLVRVGRDWLYDRKIRSHEAATDELVEQVLSSLQDEWRSGAYADEHLRDQLAIFQALVNGQSWVFPGLDIPSQGRSEERAEKGVPRKLRAPSLHTQTAEWVAAEMLGTNFDGNGYCEGAAYRPSVIKAFTTEDGKDHSGGFVTATLENDMDNLKVS